MTEKKSRHPIAVVGMSCWYPGARSLVEFWENILARRQQFRRLHDKRLPIDSYYSQDRNTPDATYGSQAAFIDGFSFDQMYRRIPKKTYEATDIVHWLALEVAEKSLIDSGLDLETLQSKQTGVVLGNTLTGEWTRTNAMRLRWPFVAKVIAGNASAQGMNESQIAEFLKACEESYKSVFPEINEDTLAGSLSNTIAGRVCNSFDFHGGGYTVDGACSSSLLAVINGARSLISGDLDVVFAGGIDISLDTFELIGFAKTGALTDGVMRVYDRRANGFIPGEGCGFVVLKRLEDAVRDGDRIYCTIDGYGISSDGKGGLTAPSIDGQASAISKAYEMAGYEFKDLSFVEGHGTGTTVGDKVEISALAKVLGDNIPEHPIGMTSLKSIVGHTKAAAGIGGFIKAAIAVNQRVIPPMAGVEEPNELFSDTARHFYPLMTGRIAPRNSTVRAGISAMGFGGINSHVTLQSYGKPDSNLAPGRPASEVMSSYMSHEILVFSAHSQTALVKDLQSVGQLVRFVSRAELSDLAVRLSQQIVNDDPFRVSIVAENAEAAWKQIHKILDFLRKPLKSADSHWEDSVDGTWGVSFRALKKKVGFVYPGQGSQAVGMGKTLLRSFKWARRRFSEADALTNRDNLILSSYITDDKVAANSNPESIHLTENAQPLITLVNSAWTEFLHRCGVEPDQTAGHSLGEISAMYGSGLLDWKDAVKIAAHRGQYMASTDGKQGTMAYVMATVEDAEELIGQVDGYVVVANVNGPTQVVVAGDIPAVEQLVDLAKQKGMRAGRLSVSNAFHSKYMDGAAESLKSRLPTFKVSRMDVPVCTKSVDTTLDDHEQVVDYLVHQVTDSVDYVAIANQMAQKVDLLIEVGPGRVLTGLHNGIAQDVQCLPLESRAGSWNDALRVLAVTFISGFKIKWHGLYGERFARPFVDPAERSFIDNPVEREMTVRAGAMPTIGTVAVPAAPVETQVDPSSVATSTEQPQETRTVIEESKATEKPKISTEEVLAGIIAEITGFDQETLSPDLRLLDDLNLDSIKVVEMVQRGQAHYGITQEIDNVDFQTATIAQVAARFDELMPAESSNSSEVTSPKTVGHEQQKPRVAKPVVSSIAESSRNQNKEHWVRNFSEIYTQKERESGLLRAVSEVEVLSTRDDSGREKLKGLLSSKSVRTLEGQSENKGNPCERLVLVPGDSAPLADVVAFLKESVQGLGPGSTVTFIQRDDGRFGTLKPRAFSVKAFAQSFHHEQPATRVRVVSVVEDSWTEVFDEIWREHCSEAKLSVTALGLEGRLVPTLTVDLPTTYTDREKVPGAGDIFLVTGGAKGITAACAFELASRSGSTMVLIGSSPNNGGEIQDTLDRYESANMVAHYFACNITDADAVTQLVQKVESEVGTVTGIIHGAGLNTPKPVSMVSVEDACREMQPKVAGFENIINAVNSESVGFVFALTSVIGVVGMPGNAWYGFANEKLNLDLRCYAQKNPNIVAKSYAYSVWSQVGMGARLGADTNLEAKGIGSICPSEGVSRFVELVYKDSGLQETVISSRLGKISDQKQVSGSSARTYGFAQNILHLQKGVEAIGRVHLTSEEHEFLLDHNYKGSLLFPTVYGLEAMAQTVEVLHGPLTGVVSVRNIFLGRPIMVGPNGHNVEIIAERDEHCSKTYHVGIRCESTGFKAEHFAATFVVDQDVAHKELSIPDFAADSALSGQFLYDGILFQGPQFQRLGKIGFLESDNETAGTALYETSHKSESRSFVLGDPGFRDSLLQSAQIIIPQNQCLPVAIDRIDITLDREDRTYRCFADVEKTGDKEYTGEISVFDEQGKRTEVLYGYQLRLLEKKSDFPHVDELIQQVLTVTQEKTESMRQTERVSTGFQSIESSSPLQPYNQVVDLLRIDAEPDGPQGQSVFVHRFIPDFKTFSTLGRNVYFSQIFNWMGWARELSSIPVMKELRELTQTGKWGQVTNWANIEILGPCESPDRVVEARLWCSQLTGSQNSSATLTFDWLAVGKDFEPVRIATGQMGFTWVEIIGHGLVQPAPFPSSYDGFVKDMMGKNDAPNVFLPAKEPWRDCDRGDQVYKAPHGPKQGVVLEQKVFETGLFEANLVGNIYFGNYSTWMGKITDRFFYQLNPEIYKDTGPLGEPACVSADIQHLREAMPFDSIKVEMRMTGLHRKGVDLTYEFFKVLPNGELEKLASGEQSIAWVKTLADRNRVVVDMPDAVFDALLSMSNNKIIKIAG